MTIFVLYSVSAHVRSHLSTELHQTLMKPAAFVVRLAEKSAHIFGSELGCVEQCTKRTNPKPNNYH